MQRRKFGDFQYVGKIVVIAMAAELFDRDQYLHGGRPQLSHQLGGLQQGAQRHQHRADACQRHGDLHPLHAIRHDQTDPGPLADAGSDECGRHGAGGVVELGVADPGLGVDDHRLVTVLLCANPDQLVDGVTHRTSSVAW